MLPVSLYIVLPLVLVPATDEVIDTVASVFAEIENVNSDITINTEIKMQIIRFIVYSLLIFLLVEVVQQYIQILYINCTVVI